MGRRRKRTSAKLDGPTRRRQIYQGKHSLPRAKHLEGRKWYCLLCGLPRVNRRYLGPCDDCKSVFPPSAEQQSHRRLIYRAVREVVRDSAPTLGGKRLAIKDLLLAILDEPASLEQQGTFISMVRFEGAMFEIETGVDAIMSTGVSEDTKTEVKENKLLQVLLPIELHRKLKAWCVKNDVTMTENIIRHIQSLDSPDE